MLLKLQTLNGIRRSKMTPLNNEVQLRGGDEEVVAYTRQQYSLVGSDYS